MRSTLFLCFLPLFSMRISSKSTFAIVLLMVFSSPVWVTHLALKNHLLEIKREVKRSILAGIPEKDQVVIKLHSSELSSLYWEHETEFEFEGNMYDVIRSTEIGDSIMYYCFKDHAESTIKRKLTTLLHDIRKEDGKSHQQVEKLQSYFTSLFPNRAFTLNSVWVDVKPVDYGRLRFAIQSTHSPPPTPPPNIYSEV